MLHCSRNSKSNIKLRGNNFTSLPNLHVIRAIASVNCCSRCANSCITEGLGKLVYDAEILFAFDSSSSWNYDTSSCQVGLSSVCRVLTDQSGSNTSWDLHILNLGRTWIFWSLLEIRRAEGQEIDLLATFDLGKSISGICGPNEGVTGLEYN